MSGKVEIIPVLAASMIQREMTMLSGEEEKREVITISITSTVDHDLLPRLNCFYVYVTADPL